jgi:hypothetical protein
MAGVRKELVDRGRAALLDAHANDKPAVKYAGQMTLRRPSRSRDREDVVEDH